MWEEKPFFSDTYNLANVLWSYKNCIENDTVIYTLKLHFNDFIMEWVGLTMKRIENTVKGYES